MPSEAVITQTVNANISVAFLRVAMAALALGLSIPAHGANRVALVVGNDLYLNAPHLRNPKNDGRLIARSLSSIGFEVTFKDDATTAALQQEVVKFGRTARGADIAIVYYAGHGIQLDGENFLIPVDANLDDEIALRVETMTLDTLLQAVSGASTRIIILDACRNNPFIDKMRMSRSIRSVSRGLARIQVTARGTMIAYSTSPGETAEDGDSANSPFAIALAQYIVSPGLEIHQIFNRVGQRVADATGNRQIPWNDSAMVGDVYLTGAPQPPALANTASGSSTGMSPPFDPRLAEWTLWQSAQSIDTDDAYDAYLHQYPSGEYSEMASVRLRLLRQRRPAPAQIGSPSHDPQKPQAADPEGKEEISTNDVIAAIAQAGPQPGKAFYDYVCSSCHAAGIGNAPKFGDKISWAPRLLHGRFTLYSHVLKGYSGPFGTCPRKGGMTDRQLPDSSVYAAVDYMVDNSR